MSQSTREAPHFYIFMDIDMTAAVAMRKQINEEGPVRVGFHDLLIAACGRGLAEHPAMNMAWDNGALRRRTEANVGLAVAIDDGLMVPVVKNADRMSLRQIAETSKSLIDKTRSKRLTPDEYEGGCLTISNLGMFEVDCFIPIINPGESAILGVGSIAEKPVVIDGAIHVRSIMTATLSADHRIVDGAIAAAFLKAVKDILEDPEQLG
jgi:pyruvate dehydrogenase E2 component (dihydrolipoamide acetyltransferase)